MVNTPISQFDINQYRTKLSSILAPAPSTMPVSTPAMIQSPAPVATPAPTPVTQQQPAPVAKTPIVNQPTVTPPQGGQSTYNGGSIVDYLASTGQSTDYASRVNLAKVYGIQNYTGTAEQNSALLGKLRGALPVTPPTQAQNFGNPTPPTPTTPLTPEQQAQADLNKKAEDAGRAGLSVSEFNATIGPSAKDRAKIASDLGITDLEASAFALPKQSTEETYKQMFKTSGLADVKSKINELNDEIAHDREDLRTAIGAVDENPFLTETSRVGRGKRILDQAEQKINNKLTQVQRYQDLYNTGISEINNSIIRAQADFTQDQTINTAKLNYLQKKAEVNLADLVSGKQSSAMGSFLKGKASTKAPDLVGNAETGFYKYDQTTGRFIQVIGKSSKTTLEEKKLIAETNKIKSEGGYPNFKPTSAQLEQVGRFVNSEEGKAKGATKADLEKAKTDPNFFYYLQNLAEQNGYIKN